MKEESIYNLIPKEKIPSPKQPKYKSKYPGELPPTYSTFCLQTTAKPGVSNVSGNFEEVKEPHTNIAMGATFGVPVKGLKDTTAFLKRGTGTFKLSERITFI